MTPETRITGASELEGNRTLVDLLDAVEGVPHRQRAALVSHVLKDVIAGKISATEASAITKAVKN